MRNALDNERCLSISRNWNPPTGIQLPVFLDVFRTFFFLVNNVYPGQERVARRIVLAENTLAILVAFIECLKLKVLFNAAYTNCLYG